MALGAVLLSLPLAIFGAFYIWASYGFNAGLGIAAYVALGTIALGSYMLVRGLRTRKRR